MRPLTRLEAVNAIEHKAVFGHWRIIELNVRADQQDSMVISNIMQTEIHYGDPRYFATKYGIGVLTNGDA